MISLLEQKFLEVISGEEAKNNLSKLIYPMDRSAGSKAETEVALKIKEMMTPYVDSCLLEGFPVTAYHRVEGRLEVVSPVNLTIPCTPGRLSGPGSGTVILLDAGDGSKSCYDRLKKEVEGAAVMASGRAQTVIGQMRFSAEDRMIITREARHRKASCFIFYMPEKRDDLESELIFNVDFPILTISNKSAAELKQLLSEHEEVKIKYESVIEYADSTTNCVVGTIIGSEFPNEVIYITGHHDSWYYGANDNISTVVSLIETAKIFKKNRPRRTIRFISWGSEESGPRAEENMLFGLGGSWGYSERYRDKLQGKAGEITIGIVNGEFMGYSPRMDAMCSSELLPLIRKTAADAGHYATAREPSFHWTLSDHVSFHTLGVPSVLLWLAPDQGTGRPSPWYKVYHTNGDRLDVINSVALGTNASLMALLALRMDSVEVPFSLESLRDATLRSINHLTNSDTIRALYDEKAKRCFETTQREERIKKISELAIVVNSSLYTLVGYAFANKFEIIGDAIAKIRDARNILEVECDLNRTRDVLLTIPRATDYVDFSKEVTEAINRAVEVSATSTRLSPYILDMRDIFDAIEEAEKHEDILAKISLKLEQAVNIAEKWGANLEKSLRDL